MLLMSQQQSRQPWKGLPMDSNGSRTRFHIFAHAVVLSVCWLSACTISTPSSAGEPAPDSLEALMFPQRVTPFVHGATQQPVDFEDAWRSNPAWVLANMSHTAYFDEKGIRKIMTSMGAPECRVYDKNGALGFLAVGPERVILTFRGTEPNDANDILADLAFVPVKLETAEVHQGFLRELDRVWPDIVKDLDRLKSESPETRRFIVTGHSLGGAMATLAATRFAFDEEVTFGEPRVGFKTETIFKAKSHDRYINGDDMIPSVPPRITAGHHGKEIRVDGPTGKRDWRVDHAIVLYSLNLGALHPTATPPDQAAQPGTQPR